MFNLNNVTAYLDQIGQDLITRILLEGETNSFVKVIPNIANSTSINILDETSPFTVAIDNIANLGFNDSATSAVTSQVNITMCPLKFQQQIPIYQAGNSVMSIYLAYLYDLNKKGSNYNSIGFEEHYAEMLRKYCSQIVDTAEWIGSYNPTGFANAHSGDTAGTTGYLATCQGFLYNIVNQASFTAATGNTIVITYSGAPSASNVIGIVDAMITATPANILKEPLIAFCSPQTLIAYRLGKKNANNFNYYTSNARSTLNGGSGSAAVNDLIEDLTPMNGVMVGVIGLTGFKGIVLSTPSNLYFGTLMVSDFNQITSWYSLDFDVWRAMIRFRLGTGIPFPDYVVFY